VTAMWILDRQRYWNFLKAYVICFVALVGLYVVIDAFSNIDEFNERAEGTAGLMMAMGRFYLIRMSLFYDRLCGVIAMMAAIFTVTWMQRNNELVAMLAAGVSTPRAIRPVLVSAVLVSLVAVVNQEWIMPPLGEELQKSHDDDGTRMVKVNQWPDTNGIFIHGKSGFREERTIAPFHATVPTSVSGKLLELSAQQARYIPADDDASPLRGGWLLFAAHLSPADLVIDDKLARLLVPLGAEDRRRLPGPIARIDDNRSLSAQDVAAIAAAPAYFLRTNVTFTAVSRTRDWYQYARTVELIRALNDPLSDSERTGIAVFLHGRLLRPLLSLALMALSLPLVLGGDRGNMFINLGLSIATSAMFYGVLFMAQYLANNKALPPELSAWAPLIVFGTLAVSRWDRIRT
jgi:lipopolysaccharide export system permease protein